MKIHCTDCRKKIAIDEAFAGGICRCPYCTALVPVPGTVDTTTVSARPAAPGRSAAPPGPARPETPVPAAAAASAAEVEELVAAGQIDVGQIPTASRVRLQGIFAMVLVGLLAVMLALVVYIIIDLAGGDGPPTDGIITLPASQNPFVTNTSDPAVTGDIEIDTPVAYVIEAAGSTRPDFDYARRMTIASVRSLDAGSFTIVLSGGQADRSLPGNLVASDAAGIAAAEKFVAESAPGGSPDLARAVRAVMVLEPRTLVVLARNDATGLMSLAAELKEKGVQVVMVALDATKSDAASQAAFAKAADGKTKAYSRSGLVSLLHESQMSGTTP